MIEPVHTRPVAVITGAYGGIGDATAHRLASEGFRLVLHGRSAEKLAALSAQIETPTVSVAGDLIEPTIASRLLSTALSEFGRCDVCVNNGGSIEVGPIASIDIDEICAMARVNVEAAYRLTYTFLKHFVGQDAGHLINISSVMGRKVRATAGAYAGTKHAMEALSEALRLELSHTNVQVSCIQPGLVATGLHDRWQTHPSVLMNIEHPLAPDDVARMIVFVLQQPPHVRIPQLMILPRDHEI